MKKYFVLVGFLITFFISNSQNSKDTLVIGYYLSPPFIMETEDESLSGISVQVWDALTESVEYDFKLERIPLYEIMDKLENGEIDICLNPLTVTSKRNEEIEFSFPFFVSNSAIAIQELSSWQKALRLFDSFFSKNFFRAVFALFFIILIFGVLVWFFEKKENPEQFSPKPHGVMSGIWWSAVTMTTVGYGDKSPQTFWGRIVALVWMFTAVIILSGFTASIASSLTVNHLEWSTNSVADFKKSPIGVIEGSATESWLKKRFYTNIKSYPTVPKGFEAISTNEVMAFLHDEPIMRYYLKNNNHDELIDILPVKFNMQFYSFGFSRKLSYELRNELSHKLLEITEETDWENLLMEYDLEVE